MELGKQGSSETSSSEENETRDHHRRRPHHQQQVVVKEEGISTSNPLATAKRFYECSYCKKGFDNAQALGGHMNIHRGAKAKAKQATSSTSNSSVAMIKSDKEYTNPSYINMAPRGGFYPSLEARSNYHIHVYSQAEFVGPRPASSPNNDVLLGSNLSLRVGSGGGEENGIDTGKVGEEDEVYLDNDELLDSNLSLRVGSGGGEENGIDTGKVGEEDEVDLELRLGHHDRY